MRRNIKTLFNFDPPATDKEIRDASLQFVRKLSGYNTPSKTNEDAFNAAVDDVFDAAKRLLTSLETNAPAKDREAEAAKAKARNAERFGKPAEA
ncbi:MAG: DUF2277 domain-containing protein [Hyphomonadaceae bacterium]|jgi:hypothetical protein|nr:DUF2277 domain-containing protein [Caulobacteraceae bacterium]MBP6689859.1 DUF2277 domain-containing protein [Hyphomonadaceae bacterium]